MRPPSPPRPLAFPTLDSLAAFLGSRLPASALASWGTAPGTKTLLNLFLELSQGECVLISAAAAAAPPSQQQQQHPVVRAVHVASVRIRNGRGALLMETGQLLSDGTLRSRGGLRPLSEKMRPGETPEAAAVRGVPEDGEFDTEEGGEHEDEVVVDGAAAAITVKRHYWKWVDDNDNDEEDVAGAEEGARQSAH
ncbi:hypothetical protein DAI22_06g279600 [Oryza sativa Japonica Group]|nr:hypothetical protein DAI22_06g279600 [Oryza sativa Japonica Group]